MKRVFHAGHLTVTTVAGVHGTNTFSCMNFNLGNTSPSKRTTPSDVSRKRS